MSTSMKLASRYIAYLLGDELDDFELVDLKINIGQLRGTPNGEGGFTGEVNCQMSYKLVYL